MNLIMPDSNSLDQMRDDLRKVRQSANDMERVVSRGPFGENRRIKELAGLIERSAAAVETLSLRMGRSGLSAASRSTSRVAGSGVGGFVDRRPCRLA